MDKRFRAYFGYIAPVLARILKFDPLKHTNEILCSGKMVLCEKGNLIDFKYVIKVVACFNYSTTANNR